MTAERLMRRLRAAGFDLEIEDSDLVVKPAENVTDWIAGLVRDRRWAIIYWLERDISVPSQRLCLDCDTRLHLGGVRCLTCRDAHPEPTCASCGGEFSDSDLSICDLCELEVPHLPSQEEGLLREEEGGGEG